MVTPFNSSDVTGHQGVLNAVGACLVVWFFREDIAFDLIVRHWLKLNGGGYAFGVDFSQQRSTNPV